MSKRNNAFDNDTIARTFFVVINPKSLDNLLIKQQWDNIPEFIKTLERALCDVLGHSNFYGTICTSKTEHNHIHLVTTEDKPTRFKALAKKLGNAHIEPMRGTKEEAEDYIEKEGNFSQDDKPEEEREKILGYFGNKKAIENNQGKRTDLDLDKLILSGELNASNIDEYILNNTHSEQSARQIETRYARVKSVQYGKKNRDVKVIYVEGESGAGKTYGAYERYKDIFTASMDTDASFKFDGYRGESTVILDELRPGIYNKEYLFKLLDDYPLSLNVKGGRFYACYTTVIICTTFPLAKWYSDENYENNDNNRKQFMRRIDEHYIVDKKTHEWIKQEPPTTKDGEWQAANNEIIQLFE